jgi:serine/threonine protein kinase
VTPEANLWDRRTIPLLQSLPESNPPAAVTLSEGVVIAGKYRLERALSRGAMGSVWVATHLALDTPVAIKFMSIQSSRASNESGSASQTVESRARFEREAKAAAQVRSANVVQILDYGVDRSTPYIVMELLQGEDLGARLKRVERMPLAEVSRLVTAVARALQRAHDAGVIHRDLKPGNIFLAKEGEDEVPKVLDFGVAKALRGDRPLDEGTHEGTMVGTPSYMSPEQAMGRTGVDHRSDLWSVGIVAFRALTGVKPFPSDSLLEVVVQICTAAPLRASHIVPGLPAGVDAFFERALQRDPLARFQSAKEMARALATVSARAYPRSARLASGADGVLDLQVDFEDPDEAGGPMASRPLRSARKRRRELLWTGAAGSVVALISLVFLLVRSRVPSTVAAPSSSASTSPTFSAEVTAPPVPESPPPRWPVSSAAAVPRPTSSLPVESAPHASGWRSPTRPAPPASSPPKKPKRDLGY